MAHVDLSFQLGGQELAADHGYQLFSAVAEVVPELHNRGREVSPDPSDPLAGWATVAIHPVQGKLTGGRRITLTSRSRLTVRVPGEFIDRLLPLVGKTLVVAGARLKVGPPVILPLRPSATLTSRLVLIKGFADPVGFLEAVGRQAQALDVAAAPTILRRRAAASVEGRTARQSPDGDLLRRTIRIHDKEIVGYAVGFQGLTAEESIRLQEHGIGGRRKLGCGVFTPTAR